MNEIKKQDIKFMVIVSAIFLFFAAISLNDAPFLSGMWLGVIIGIWVLYLESK